MRDIILAVLVMFMIVSCTGAIQTADAPYVGAGSLEREIVSLYGSCENYFVSRFGSFENYMNIGYGNVPYE